jgi:DNA repair exonuclease SbcCD nuclease subunit
MKLVHTADIHLGRRRLDGRWPDKDLANAFAFVARQAIAEKADAFLIAGDLFDRPQVEPPHLRQAQQVLAELKAAYIPVIAIEGNHDKAFIHSDDPTWLNYLAEDGLLTLLHTSFDAAGPLLKAWDEVSKSGSWIDLHGVRFVGAGYLGAATPHKVRQIISRLEPGQTHVLLLHAGPEYFVGEGGGFSAQDLEGIREKVCYLALGHIHRPMTHDNWACNPGSLENCDLREAAVKETRGYAMVEIDPGQGRVPLSLEIHEVPRRPCRQLTLDCTPFGNKLKNGADALVDAAVDLIRAAQLPGETIVDLRLVGRLNLDRIAFDTAAAADEIEKAARVQAVAIDTTGLNIDTPQSQHQPEQELNRDAIEHAAIRSLVHEENLWGLEGREEEFCRLFYDLKEAARAGKTGEDLAESIIQSPLIDSIQHALEERDSRGTRQERDRWKEQGESAAKGFDLLVHVAEVQTELKNQP